MKSTSITTNTSPIHAPKIPAHPPLPLQPIAALQDKDEFRLCTIRDCEIVDQQADKVSFDQVVFQNVTFSECQLNHVELLDVVFDHCDLSNVHFSEAIIHRTVFRHCKMIGTDFTKARFQHMLMSDCLADYATFRLAQFKFCGFETNSLISADYYQTKLHKTTFTECNIDQAVFAESRLAGIDLSSCSFSGIIVDCEDLPDCIIAADQAASFANLLGLVIK